ncbi:MULTISPECIES: glycosyltransferase family 4 protein [Vibrio]|uniref:glycosyltransferase family 4 protein n=1 Tax=Vibrio TaxID=662 RepID=UPI000DE30D98|nr:MULTISPECIES: glycosyltransferase family 1 protein [Vibrio]RBM63627.1 glycosyltransferase family 1 protein [Vibrio paracholerae]TQQ42022.1 glycosyltransferase family 4 protein [Vibrio cholerae]
MILFDPIIYHLQKGGGITVYFSSIQNRIKAKAEEHIVLTIADEKLANRYRDCDTGLFSGVFHSSYYRLPTNRELKIVTTVHDFTYEKFVRGPAKWVHCWQKYRAIKHSDIVICVSHNTAGDLMHYCPIDPSKIRVIHNGVSESYHVLPDVQSKTNEVLFVGARAGYKNFELAIDALVKRPELSLSIVGGGPLSEAEQQRLEARIPGRYTWLGRLSDEELNLAYNRAYALLYPSSYEGFGIPIIEAMRAGCPVIAVNVSSIPEVAGSAAILTDAADADLFASALLSIPQRREALVAAGLEQAKKFSWDKCFEETLQVYKELM